MIGNSQVIQPVDPATLAELNGKIDGAIADITARKERMAAAERSATKRRRAAGGNAEAATQRVPILEVIDPAVLMRRPDHDRFEEMPHRVFGDPNAYLEDVTSDPEPERPDPHGAWQDAMPANARWWVIWNKRIRMDDHARWSRAHCIGDDGALLCNTNVPYVDCAAVMKDVLPAYWNPCRRCADAALERGWLRMAS